MDPQFKASKNARPFPQPVRLSARCTRWRLSDVRIYETGRDGIAPEDERWLTDRQMGERFGVTRVCIWEWARAARKGAA